MSEPIGPVDVTLYRCPCCGAAAVCENFIIEAAVRCTGCRLTVKRQHQQRADTGIMEAVSAWNRRS